MQGKMRRKAGVEIMAKKFICILICCLMCLWAVPSLAQEQSLPVVSITCRTDASLSPENAVDAQVVMVDEGQEIKSDAALRLYDESLGGVELTLPQKSLYVESSDARFVLYNGGYDGLNTMVISAVCSDLITQGPIDIAVCAQEPVEVYMNGDYWGLYTKRETIVDAIARFEGLTNPDTLNVTNVNHDTLCGDVDEITKKIRMIRNLNLSREEDRMTFEELLDTESFLNWFAINAFWGTGNFFGEAVFYTIDGGSLKCAVGRTDYAFVTANANPFATLDEYRAVHLDAAVLANMMLEQPVYRDAFLTKLGLLYQTFTTSMMQEAVDTENALIASALPAHMSRWTEEFYNALEDEYLYPPANAQEALLYQQYRVYRLRDKTLVRRPGLLYELVQSELNVSDEEMERYFGGSKPTVPEVPGDTWEDYKASHMN